MNVSCYIFCDPNIHLWHLSSRVRYQRMLSRMGVVKILNDLRDLPAHDSVLLIRGDFLYDERVFSFLLKQANVVLKINSGDLALPVAAHVDGSLAYSTLVGMENDTLMDLPQLRSVTLNDLSLSFSNELRKSDCPYVFPVRKDNQRALEEHLFTGSYKGVTDCVTKFLWPGPAKGATNFCARHGISPNQVTTMSLLLVMMVVGLFAYGYYAVGLFLGWVMTFLDTVDGKLARVTVTSSKWGNIFDHGIDLIHPPIWYIAWGLGLSTYSPFMLNVSLEMTLSLILIGYIVGRMVEGVFQWFLAGFVIFCWRPFDSFFRLIAARRNPNLIFLTASVLFGRPDLGLEAVAVWTVFCTIILLGRLLGASWVKATGGSLQSWLAKVDIAKDRDALAVRLFTNPPATVK